MNNKKVSVCLCIPHHCGIKDKCARYTLKADDNSHFSYHLCKDGNNYFVPNEQVHRIIKA